MSNLVIQSKLLPPKTQSNIVSRQRLLKLLNDNYNKNLILVCAPAGYGKTTLIQEYISQSSYKYSWLQASHDIKNFFTFINYLVLSLRKSQPEFGKNTLQLLESVKERRQITKNKNEIIPEVIGTFINEFHRHFNEHFVLVIDDLNNIDKSEWLNLTLNQIIENIPANLHLVLISREIPGFNISKFEAQRNVLEITSKELHFNFDEISRLLEEVYNYEAEANSVKELENKLDGWITGIHLLLQAHGKEFAKVITGGQILPDNIFNFFANEIFRNLDDGIQFLLLETAPLDSFDINISDYLLNIKESKKIINSLLSKNIFIQQTDDISRGTVQFSYQYLFKNFLMTKFYDLKTDIEIKETYRKIINYYKNIDDIVSALNYSISANEIDESISLTKDNFQKFFDDGKIEYLWKWFGNIMEDRILKDPQLSYYKGTLCKYFASDLEIPLNYINNAITLYEKGSKSPLLIDCYLFKAGILLNMGRTQEVLEDLIKLIEVKTTNEKKAKLLYFLGYAFFINTQYNEALNYLNKSLEVCSRNNFKHIQFDIYNILGHLYLNQGDFVKSAHYFEQNYEKSSNIDKRLVTIYNFVDLYALAGKYDKAKSYLDKGVELTMLFAVPIYELILLISAARLRFEAGDFEETIRLSEKANLLSKKFNRKRQIYLSYWLISESYYYLNKLSKAEEYLKLAEIYINESNKFQSTEFSCYKAILSKKLHQTNEIEVDFIDAYKFFEENHFLYDKIQVGFHLAEHYFFNGSIKSALKYIGEVVTQASQKEYVSYLEKVIIESRRLFDFALINNIEKEFIKSIFTSVIDRFNIKWLSGDCKERLLKQNDNLYDIKMTAFGILEFKVRGVLIEEDKWKRKMRKLILAYLLLYPDKPLSKDKAIDLFFPDSPGESVENIFHQSISNIRNAVKPEYGQEKSSSKTKAKNGKNEEVCPVFLIYEDKVLKLNHDYIYNVDINEFNKLYNLFFSTSSTPEAKLTLGLNAAALYKDEPLSGYYYDWCEEIRNEYSGKFIRLSTSLIEMMMRKKMFEEVIIYSEKLLKADKLNEFAYLNLIEAHINLDSLNRAKDIFSNMLKMFEAELGEKPSKAAMDKIMKLLS